MRLEYISFVEVFRTGVRLEIYHLIRMKNNMLTFFASIPLHSANST